MNGRNSGRFSVSGGSRALGGPGEQRRHRAASSPCQYSSTSSTVDVEGLREGDLGEPRRNADAHRPGRQLEQRIAARRHRAGRAARAVRACTLSAGHRRAARRRLRATRGRRHDVAIAAPATAGSRSRRCRRQIAAQRATAPDRPARISRLRMVRCLDRREIEPVGQRRQRPAAIGIGRGAQIVGDQRAACRCGCGCRPAHRQGGERPPPQSSSSS